jgi:protease-4
MAGKKHPILTVLVILGVTALFLGAVMVIVLGIFSPSSDLSFNEKIGVVSIEGPISDSHKITTEIVNLKKDTKIKAIILRINSPGGSVGPSQEIYREVRRTKRTKNVIASMGEVAASGAYYIAAGADRIVANPGTITGSIGVIMQFMQFRGLLDKIGIHFEVLKSGEFKDIGSPHRELTEQDKALIDALIRDIQTQFVEAVAEGRNLSIENVQQIADGRILSGSQAKALGLVDRLGNFHDAVEMAKKMAGIEGDVTLVYPEKDGMELWELFLERTAGVLTRLIKSTETRIEYRWRGFSGHGLRESY